MTPADDDNEPATRGDLRALEGCVNERFEKVDERFDKIDERLDKMDGRLDKMDGRLDKMDGRLDKMDARFDKMDGKFDALSTMIIELRTELLADNARHAKAITEDFRGQLRIQGEDIARVEAKLDAHIADASVHVSAAPGRGGRASRTRRRR